jgi:PTS system beta-glucosides-specific IIC component
MFKKWGEVDMNSSNLENEKGPGTVPIAETVSSKARTSLVERFFEVIANSFAPLVPVIVGASLVNMLFVLLLMVDLDLIESDTLKFLKSACDAILYFLPTFFGATLARSLKANPYIGAVIGVVLIDPTILELGISQNIASFLGPSEPLQNYSTYILPVLIAVSAYAFLERLLRRVIGISLHQFLIPFISLLIMVPLAMAVIGPVTIYAMQWAAEGSSLLVEFSPILGGVVIGALWVFILLLRAHWIFVPYMMESMAATGSNFIGAFAVASTAVLVGIALGVLLRIKSRELKILGGLSFVTSIVAGVAEPILYGIIVRYRGTLIYIVAASAAGGAAMGMLDGRQLGLSYTASFSNMLLLGSGVAYFSICIASLLAGVLLPVIFGYESTKAKRLSKPDAV